MHRLFISSAHKSSGKTTISTGLIAAFRKSGVVPQPFKKGPDYIDPMWLSLAANRDCHNLDFYTMGHEEIWSDFARLSIASDLALIEGNKGLYDGLDLDGSNSNAALARLLQAPVILVLDARGMTRGIAPLILGYQSFDERVNIAGVILNKLGGARHEAKLRAIIEHYTDVPVVGALHRDAALDIGERHLGLIPSQELDHAPRRIAAICEAVTAAIDMDAVQQIGASAPPLTLPAVATASQQVQDVQIGVARDVAFSFYYASDLAALRAAGARLQFFDTVNNAQLPDVDALFIGGGFPETQAAGLSANATLRAQIRGFIDNGGPVYAECGGLMYLSRSITWRGQRFEMVGAIPADVLMEERPVGRGYVRLKDTGRGPWPLRGDHERDVEIPAHEFHHSRLINIDSAVDFAYDVLRGTGIDGQHDGLIYKKVLASYTHLRDTTRNRWARRFVDYVRQVRSKMQRPAKRIDYNQQISRRTDTRFG